MRSVMTTTRWVAAWCALAFMVITTIAHAGELPVFTGLVKDNSPAVVNISTTQKVKSSRRSLPPGIEIPDLPEGSPFGDLFRHFFGEGGEGDPEQEHESKSLGSGFVISDDGYVLTNAHVVKNAEEIIVRMSDRREFVAKVVGTDSRSDVAVLKIDATGLPVVRIGDPATLEVGEWVLAIGSPFGFDHSVTAGIVSAKGRSLPRENYVPFIQTDVAINPGNSGGPLFNLEGEVVGINSQIYSRTGGFMGLSFAIPIDVAMDVVEQIKTTGHVTRGWLGVLIQDVTRELAESFGMKQPRGALIAQVMPNSPAEKGGIEVGDIITSYNGQEVSNSAILPPMVGRTKIGKSVKVKVLRAGKTKTLKVKIGELPDTVATDTPADEPEPATASANRLGLVVSDLNAAQRKKLEIEAGQGILVTESRAGIAQEAGVRAGDVIMMLNYSRVNDVLVFQKLVKELPKGGSVPILVQRRNGPVFLALKLQEKE